MQHWTTISQRFSLRLRGVRSQVQNRTHIQCSLSIRTIRLASAVRSSVVAVDPLTVFTSESRRNLFGVRCGCCTSILRITVESLLLSLSNSAVPASPSCRRRLGSSYFGGQLTFSARCSSISVTSMVRRRVFSGDFSAMRSFCARCG